MRVRVRVRVRVRLWPGTLRPSASSWVHAAPRRLRDSVRFSPTKAAASEAARLVAEPRTAAPCSAVRGRSRRSSLRASLTSRASRASRALASSIDSPPSLAARSASRASRASLLALAAPRT